MAIVQSQGLCPISRPGALGTFANVQGQVLLLLSRARYFGQVFNNVEFKWDLNLILSIYLEIWVLKMGELLNLNTLNMHKHVHLPIKKY